MTTPVCWVSYRRATIASGYGLQYHDQGRLWRTFNEANARSGDVGYAHYDGFEELPEGDEGAVVVLPAQHHHLPHEVERLNADLAKLRWVVLVLAGDEESLFPWRKVEHPNLAMWVMTPRPHLHADCPAYFFGEGYRYSTPDTLAQVAPEAPTKPLTLFFAGQGTHARRKAMLSALRPLRDRHLMQIIETAGFLQGIEHRDYMAHLASAKIAPCPSGPGTPDSFRLYEALEAGCLPLADATTPEGWTGYWEFTYGEVPFPVVEDWSTVGDVIADALAGWPANANRAQAWWGLRKREMAQRLDDDVWRVSWMN